MKIYLVRHGQTDLNKDERMQGRVDEPLNETGIKQAHITRGLVGDLKFDAVYASPLGRAIKTATIVGDVDESEIIIDERLIETEFGKYDKCKYKRMGPAMTLYWALPEIFPAPDTVETVESMVSRARSFMQELEEKDYDTVLIAAHGGILRALNGYLLEKKNGIKWRPKMHNCDVRIYEYKDGKHTLLDILRG
jgi:alpha-ribazole phosphatase/probable phosphoglycerate mutase